MHSLFSDGPDTLNQDTELAEGYVKVLKNLSFYVIFDLKVEEEHLQIIMLL